MYSNWKNNENGIFTTRVAWRFFACGHKPELGVRPRSESKAIKTRTSWLEAAKLHGLRLFSHCAFWIYHSSCAKMVHPGPGAFTSLGRVAQPWSLTSVLNIDMLPLTASKTPLLSISSAFFTRHLGLDAAPLILLQSNSWRSQVSLAPRLLSHRFFCFQTKIRNTGNICHVLTLS